MAKQIHLKEDKITKEKEEVLSAFVARNKEILRLIREALNHGIHQNYNDSRSSSSISSLDHDRF